MSKGFASNYRIVLLATCVLLMFGGVATRLVCLHVIDRDKLVRHIEQARRQIQVENAVRGDIIDRRGNPLAISRTMIELAVDPQVLRAQDEAKWPELARLIGMPLNQLKDIFNTKVSVADPADPESRDRVIQWAKLRDEIPESLYDQINALGIKGVYGTRGYSRTYPQNRLAAHIVGYVNKENIPATGIERYADFYLQGQNGWRESEKDGRQREMAQFRSRDVPATNGYSVMLSIDSAVQSWVEEELDTIVRDFNPDNAVIIVSDATTGSLLAMGNYPTFNLNEYNKAPMEAQKNFAISSQIDPGSTFKIVAASGALNEGLVTPGTRFDCSQAVVEYMGKPRRLIDDDHPSSHPMAVSEIISQSSNRGAALLAMRLGDRKFYDYARAFGFGEKTGFPLVGEISGVLHDPKKWSGSDITRIPAGYSISATPLQIHYGMGVIASGGLLFRPQLISEVRAPSGETIHRFGSKVERRVISEKTAQEVALMLRGVLTEGTGKGAEIPGYQIAGKTGTARKLIDGRYSDNNHVGSFTGFFPASAPRVVITVIVDNGRPKKGDAYGSVVAVPSFKRLAGKLIPYLDIKPVEPIADRALVATKGGRP
ncbi:peptidoglycan glycosyltransferase [Nibricoccus aquaticus]|uniref:Peptidoglycan glycosyltransferase n=1 Tax=Nibricoccus aquaticus TaxID=2576891 RepID=A0A290Q8W6_9BACT|nr:penicillin-binding protein 2 [Nibricoccus aquaticus]ATC64687.1 peptidoglycan glycosyltransferase [Nibricoccus aquaticus]